VSPAATRARAEARGRRPRLGAVLGLALWAGLGQAAGPAENYLLHCVGCHREDGSGSRRNAVPDLRGSVGHFLTTAAGRAYLVQVAGAAQAPLSDADLAELVNWLVTTFAGDSLPASFTPYAPREVEALRAMRPADLDGLRGRIAHALRADGRRVADY
jgi:cytochrome c553